MPSAMRPGRKGIMKEHEIKETAAQLLSTHGLAYVPVKTTNARRYMGKAVAKRTEDGGSTPSELRLSKRILSLLPREEVIDTILHEIAHFIAGVHNGHNEAWRAACVRVGANPERTADIGGDVRAAVSKYRLTCEECGQEHYMNRRPKYAYTDYRCGSCGGPVGPLEVLGE